MGKLITLTTFFIHTLFPLFGQRTLVRMPIEGFHGIGEVLAYSSSRLFLTIDKDGEWPRQIIWEIKKVGNPFCTITFNKVGWQYTSVTNCTLDWMHMDPKSFSHRLFVLEQAPSPPELELTIEKESITLTRSQPAKTSLPPRPTFQTELEKTSSNQLKSEVIIDSSQNKSLPEKRHTGNDLLINQQPHTNTTFSNIQPDVIDDSTAYFSARKLIKNDYLITNHSIDSTHIFNETLMDNNQQNNVNFEISDSIKYSLFKELGTPNNAQKISLPNTYFKLYSTEFSPHYLESSAGKKTNLDNFDNPKKSLDNPSRRKIFGNKDTLHKSPKSVNNSSVSFSATIPSNQNDIIELLDSLSVDLTTAPSNNDSSATTPVNSTSPITRILNAPFISVASFETIEYAQQVLDQFNCPNGCIIVRSQKGQYYRIGFYPDPENIIKELNEIRKIYSDAWLVKF